MVSYVHLWNDESFASFGHISLSLPNGVYISFWPKNVKRELCKAVVGGESRWFETTEQEMKENGMPTKTLPVLDLDIEEITVWWEEFKQSSPKWTLLGNSCSNIVYEALCKGNSWFIGRKEGTSTTPTSVVELVEGFTTNRSCRINSSCCCKPCGSSSS